MPIMPTMETISSKYIKSKRKFLGMTQRELSDFLGIKRVNLTKYECGRTMPSGDLILRLQRLAKLKGSGENTNGKAA